MPISAPTFETPALETLYDSQFTFSTQLIKPNYLALRLLITSITLKRLFVPHIQLVPSIYIMVVISVRTENHDKNPSRN